MPLTQLLRAPSVTGWLIDGGAAGLAADGEVSDGHDLTSGRRRFDLLQMDLYGQLDEAESLASTFEEWTDQETDTARKLIPDLVLVIRGLLFEHQMQPSGDCRICAPPWP